METPKKIDDETSTWDNFRDRPEPTPIDYESTEVVGKFYKDSWPDPPDPHRHPNALPRVYYCESYDPRYGYWMAEVDPVTFREFPGRRVTNVSERAPGRTYHLLNAHHVVRDRIDLAKGV